MKTHNVGPRKFNMNSVGGNTHKTSRRKLDRMAHSHGYQNAKQMYLAMLQEQFRKQMLNPEQFGSVTPMQEAA